MKELTEQFENAEQGPIFCGQYYDDMSCVGFLGDPFKEKISVLMLGLADGLALAPIGASNRVAKLLAVDLDDTALVRSLHNQRRLGSHVDFDAVVDDAEQFLDATRDRYDVIVIDLYTQCSYAQIVFDRGFHHLLKTRLNLGGHLVFNGFGVPMNLDPFNGPTPQAWLAQSLRESWGDIHHLPHRRNATFIIGAPPEMPPVATGADEFLYASDQVFMDLMSLRLRYLIPTFVREVMYISPALDFAGIDLEAQKRWKDSLPTLSALLPPSLKLRVPSDLRVLLEDCVTCQALQEQLLNDKSSLRTTVALLIAGEVNFSDRDMSWLPDWVVTRLENSSEIDPRDWLEGLLPYAYGVVINEVPSDSARVDSFRRVLARLSSSAS